MDNIIIEGKAHISAFKKLLLVMLGIVMFFVTDTLSSELEVAYSIRYVINIIGLIISGLLVISPLLIPLTIGKCKICVTNKVVYGIAGLLGKKRVDLPLDSISSVGMSSFNGISVSTASGTLTFFFIENRDQIHSVLSGLIVDRQSKIETVNVATKNNVNGNSVDQLKSYKELLDMGAISQSEFEAKKEQILGISNEAKAAGQVYSCPNCKNQVKYGDTSCNNCGTIFNWN
ncbi:MAG: SHOCT domain-containing protein [Acutalibacteraceae bacterium]